jgi:hypothetical protein
MKKVFSVKLIKTVMDYETELPKLNRFCAECVYSEPNDFLKFPHFRLQTLLDGVFAEIHKLKYAKSALVAQLCNLMYLVFMTKQYRLDILRACQKNFQIIRRQSQGQMVDLTKLIEPNKITAKVLSSTGDLRKEIELYCDNYARKEFRKVVPHNISTKLFKFGGEDVKRTLPQRKNQFPS